MNFKTYYNKEAYKGFYLVVNIQKDLFVSFGTRNDQLQNKWVSNDNDNLDTWKAMEKLLEYEE